MTSAPVRPYGFGATLQLPYAEAVERTQAALKDQGFGVLTEIDVRKTMKEKLDVEFRPYVILGACNPQLSLVGDNPYHRSRARSNTRLGCMAAAGRCRGLRRARGGAAAYLRGSAGPALNGDANHLAMPKHA